MPTDLTRLLTPEDRELEKKRAELAAIEAELVQCELALATLRAELTAFESEYLKTVGVKYAELDAIEAEIAELIARARPSDAKAQQRAPEARAAAEESAHTVSEEIGKPDAAEFSPSVELKKLYRQIAKQVHPDLASSEEDRARRLKVMSEVNDAFAACDEDRLRAILRNWQSSPESVQGTDAGAELIRAIRKISRAQDRLVAIAGDVEKLKAGSLYELKTAVQTARDEGRDLFAEMLASITGRMEHTRMQRNAEKTRIARP